jgi:hypothetical protein
MPCRSSMPVNTSVAEKVGRTVDASGALADAVSHAAAMAGQPRLGSPLASRPTRCRVAGLETNSDTKTSRARAKARGRVQAHGLEPERDSERRSGCPAQTEAVTSSRIAVTSTGIVTVRRSCRGRSPLGTARSPRSTRCSTWCPARASRTWRGSQTGLSGSPRPCSPFASSSRRSLAPAPPLETPGARGAGRAATWSGETGALPSFSRVVADYDISGSAVACSQGCGPRRPKRTPTRRPTSARNTPRKRRTGTRWARRP